MNPRSVHDKQLGRIVGSMALINSVVSRPQRLRQIRSVNSRVDQLEAGLNDKRFQFDQAYRQTMGKLNALEKKAAGARGDERKLLQMSRLAQTLQEDGLLQLNSRRNNQLLNVRSAERQVFQLCQEALSKLSKKRNRIQQLDQAVSSKIEMLDSCVAGLAQQEQNAKARLKVSLQSIREQLANRQDGLKAMSQQEKKRMKEQLSRLALRVRLQVQAQTDTRKKSERELLNILEEALLTYTSQV